MCASDQPHVLRRDEVLSIFKMYEDKGWSVKQQMINIVTWLTTFVFGLIAFSARDLCSSSAVQATGLAGLAAVLLSAVMLLLVIGSLKHADLDYLKADEVLEPAKNLFPEETFNTIRKTPKRWLPTVVRLGMPRIGGVHIFLMYLAFLLLVFSVVAWRYPTLLCQLRPGGG